MISAGSRGFAARTRTLLADVLELLQVRLELATLEARDDAARLIGIAASALAAVMLISFGLAFFALLITVLLWSTHPVLALGISAMLFCLVGLFFAWLAWHRLRSGLALLAATREELRRDHDALRP